MRRMRTQGRSRRACGPRRQCRRREDQTWWSLNAGNVYQVKQMGCEEEGGKVWVSRSWAKGAVVVLDLVVTVPTYLLYFTGCTH